MKQPMDFKALSQNGSQGTTSDVLFVCVDSPATELWEAAYSRFDAVRQLNNELAVMTNEKLNNSALAVVNNILLSDAMGMFNLLGERLSKYEEERK